MAGGSAMFCQRALIQQLAQEIAGAGRIFSKYKGSPVTITANHAGRYLVLPIRTWQHHFQVMITIQIDPRRHGNVRSTKTDIPTGTIDMPHAIATQDNAPPQADTITPTSVHGCLPSCGGIPYNVNQQISVIQVTIRIIL
jgi:hypothetical protein